MVEESEPWVRVQARDRKTGEFYEMTLPASVVQRMLEVGRDDDAA